jgi:hypothetical protein
MAYPGLIKIMKPRFACRLGAFAAAAVHLVGVALAETGDPAGYITMRMPADAKGLLAGYLVNSYSTLGTVTGVGADYIEYGSDLPANLLGKWSSAFLEIRVGSNAGLSLPVTGFSGKRVTLGRSPLGLISPGDRVGVRPNWSLGELVTPIAGSQLLEGESAETADTLGLLDPVAQTMRVFYRKTGEGWREAGQESAGDCSSTPVPFPAALQFHRRASTDLDLMVIGAVPMPFEGTRMVPVWPGRNLIAGPLTSATRLDQWMPFDDLLEGDSAPHADTVRLSFAFTPQTPVIYRRTGEGWHYVGAPGDAGQTPMDLAQAIDLQREGAAGYLKFAAVTPQAGALRVAAAAAETVVPVDLGLCVFPARQIGWASEPGKTYQVQVQPRGSSTWSDAGAVVVAQAETCKATVNVSGNGTFRIVER